MALLALFLTLAAHATTTVPLTLEPALFGGGRMSAPCQLGSAALACVIDTGANVTSLHGPYLAEESARGTSTYRSVGGTPLTCANLTVPASLGGEAPRTLEPVRCPLAPGENSRAILGLDYFAGRRADFDLNNRTLTIDSPAPLANPRPFRVDSMGHALLALEIGNAQRVPVTALFDTGAFLTLVSKSFVRAHPELFERTGGAGDFRDGVGESQQNELLVMSTLHCGERYFVAEYVMAVDFTAMNEAAGQNLDFVVGYNLIRQAAWRFDFGRREWDVN